MIQRTVVETDLLIVGGSGAAITAAVAAHKEGVRVAMAVKGKAANSGNMIMVGGGLSIDGENARSLLHNEDANPKYTKDSLFQKLVTSSFWLGDQEIQKQFLDAGAEGVRDMLQWAEACGHSAFEFNPKACRWRTSGGAVKRSMKYGLEQEAGDVDLFEDTVITDLLTNDGKVCGAVGIRAYTGELIEFRAGAVLLATGGYQPLSLKGTNSDMTGDGIAMALMAGAEIKDMEFLLFIPLLEQPTKFKGSLLPFLMTMSVFPLKFTPTDLDGKELIYPQDSRYHPTPENMKVSKLLMSYFYGKGLYEKWDQYGHRFYFDFSRYTDQEILDGFESFASRYTQWHGRGRYHHIDLMELARHIIANDKRLMVGLGNEYSMGGITVDENFASTVPGLYAAGEVTAGLFGAFRSGDGLVEMVANGRIAGRSAAQYARNCGRLEPQGVEEKLQALLAPLERTEGESPIQLRNELDRLCDDGFNCYRDGFRIQRAYEGVLALKERAKKAAAPGGTKYNLELLNALALRNLLTCCEVGLYSALSRKESRGCHLRADFPQVDNQNFRFSYTAKWEKGSIVYGKSYPRAVYVPLEDRNFDNVAECIAETILGRDSK